MSDSRADEGAPRVLKNKWRLDRVIGAGGMAVVYEATHRNGMKAAVKMLRRELSWEPELRGRFLREGYLANTVGHPGVPQVFDDDIDEDGSVFLVMELLVGETAEAARKREGGRLSVAETVRVGTETLDVLVAAHEKGVVHRDIKPDNIFLTSEGNLKVLDFGIARVRAAQGTQTQTGSLLGTPAYMSPEQARGHWEDVDARTDVWAVGATLFTLLSGQFVHTGRTGAEALVDAVTKPARPLASVVGDVPEELCAIIDQALVFNRDERWPSARAMQEALLAFSRRTAPTPAVEPMAVEDGEVVPEFPESTAPDMIAVPSMATGSTRAPSAVHHTPGAEEEDEAFLATATRAASRRRGLITAGGGGLAVVALLVWWLARGPSSPPAAAPTPRGVATPIPAAAPIAPTAGTANPHPVTAPPVPAASTSAPAAPATTPPSTTSTSRRPGVRGPRPTGATAAHHTATPAAAPRPRPSSPSGTPAPATRPARPDVDLHDSRR